MTTQPKFSSTFETSSQSVKDSILYHLKYSLAHDIQTATQRDWWLATSKAIQERVIERMIATMAVHNREDVRRVYYLSLEFLMGRLFNNSIYSVGLFKETEQALHELGLRLEDLRGEEYDMGLGNGGLGRLAACFLDSLATLDYPAVGYGIHYEFGLFRQQFNHGHQIELPDDWMRYGTPWEIVRPEFTQAVELYGHVENVFDDKGNYVPRWKNTKKIIGIPYDIPIAGYGTNTVNFLRLWESRPSEKINLEAFNRGGYSEALAEKTQSETVSKVLYPNDKTEAGKELRLIQQYFFVSCSLRDIIRRFHRIPRKWSDFPDKVAIQLNDTHPALAVVELLRILHDENGLPWDEAWGIVTRTMAYTNHTLLPEALEKWSVPLFQKVLPRHLQLIFEINKRLIETIEASYPGDSQKKRSMSLIEEGGVQMVRMANLAVVGSHSVNGVAALHTELLKKHLFSDFDAMYPGRINNKTNGITPRRWLLASNPRLSNLIASKIGDAWARNLDELRKLEQWADDPAFQNDFMAVKHANKVHLAEIIQAECGVKVDPSALFDVQIKRLHEYKRQHLNLLHILALYRRILQNPKLDIQPRVFIFGAKAAPGYELAKCIIKAINAVGDKINGDPRVGDKLKVVFLPNYRVSLAQRIIPAADVSEQISTAGKEASGTGNMKLALNGALTVGTLDGANVEILEEVGPENIFIFGLTVDQVEALWHKGYHPHDYYNADEELRAVVDWVGSNYFTPDEPGALAPLRHSLLEGGDPYLCLPDFRAYSDAQEKIDAAYRDKPRWARMAIMNTARVGKFSSDRTIHEYAREIWKLPQVPV
ncbi:MAG TPA: glycogen/starch/alpha-glucan phosphorylase [Candidatus Methylacidiphilales bacterium]|jgi:starch phosphorylase|nr:glycogen/starch/alpha-glucan phosphorylase [Candidatus Methylacidiphilales bacterium]